MGFNCGIVGLPNVGKSTLFNCLTKAGIEAANYPFCTIEPNVGIVAVPDNRLNALAEIVKPQAILPTTMEFVDIAGLVAGAAKGEGLGNKFLSHIRETHAIAHVVRCFEDDDIVHVSGKIDPIRDIEIIQTELALSDLEAIGRAIQKCGKKTRAGDKVAIKEMELLERVQAHLNETPSLHSLGLTESDHEILKELHLLSAKPVMYIANVAEGGFENNPMLDAVRAYAQREHAIVVPISAMIEAEIAELEEQDRQEFLKDLGWKDAGLDRVIRAGYDLLGLQTYFTAGVKEVRAWTILKGMTAPQAAGKIHTDFEKGFIRAEVIAYEDYIQYRGEAGAKEAGKWRLEGKDYIVLDGDVMLFRFNV